MRARAMIWILPVVALLAAPVQAQTAATGSATTEEVATRPPLGAEGTPDFAEHASLAGLSDELAELWQTRPELFEAVDAARDALIDYHRGGAWRPMNITRRLDAIGDDRLLPLLWALASDDPFELGMGLKAWVAWRVGLIESVGRLRDPRSVSLLLEIVEGDAPQTAIRRAAVSALGRTGDAAGIAAVIAVAEASPDRRAAVIEGLGQARREIAADFLVAVARSDGDVALRRVAVRALGDWGNAEAWRTPVLAPWADEGEAGRRTIVEALVDAYPAADAVLRAEIEKTLQLVDVHGTAARASRLAAQTDDAARRAAFSELEAAMARSPLGARQRR